MKAAIKNAIREVAIDAITELVKQIRDTEWTITVKANKRCDSLQDLLDAFEDESNAAD